MELILGLADKETQKQRWDMCNVCEHLTKNNFCRKCGCLLRIKILFQRMYCPVGKWGSA